MAVCCELVLRQRFCRDIACGKRFWICRHCDRGQRYCSPLCRQQAYRQQRRRANRRHHNKAPKEDSITGTVSGSIADAEPMPA